MIMSLPTKPYILRALYEWCGDNGYTPYIAVWVNEYTRVPRQHVKDNQITLNISFDAVKDLLIDNEWISFHARFAGVAQEVMVPVGHVIGIFAKETGEGMGFEVEPWLPEDKRANPSENQQQVDGHTEGNIESRPKKGLRLVK